MNVYIIYSYRDYQRVSDFIDKLKSTNESFNPHNMDGGARWKRKAKNAIHDSNFVLFFCGRESHNSSSIGWEIKRALKYEKQIYTVKLENECELHPELLAYDAYSGRAIRKDKAIDLEQLTTTISQIINDYLKDDYGLFNTRLADGDYEDSNTLIEQYKLYVQTSEAVVDRRQKANSYYLSVNSFFLTVYLANIEFVKAFAVTSGSDATTSRYLIYTVVISLLITGLGILLCLSWKSAIQGYCDLNTGKYKIILKMEERLSTNMFGAEWEALSDKLNVHKYKEFTSSERRVPVIFIVAYTFLFFFTCATTVLSLAA